MTRLRPDTKGYYNVDTITMRHALRYGYYNIPPRVARTQTTRTPRHDMYHPSRRKVTPQKYVFLRDSKIVQDSEDVGYEIEDRMFGLCNSPSSGVAFNVRKTRSNKLDAVSIFNNGTGVPTFALYYDRQKVYIWHFGATKKLSDVIKAYKIPTAGTDIGQVMGTLFKNEVPMVPVMEKGKLVSRCKWKWPNFELHKAKRKTIYELTDYLGVLRKLDTSLLPNIRFKGYLSKALQHFDAETVRLSQPMTIAAQMAKIFPLEGREQELVDAYEGNHSSLVHDYHLGVYNILGRNLAVKIKDLGDRIKAIGYLYEIQHENGAIDLCHKITHDTRECRGENRGNMDSLIGLEESRKTLRYHLNKIEPLSLRQLLDMIADKTLNIPFDAPKKYISQQKNNPEKFRKMMGKGMEEPLIIFWHLRHEMFNIETWSDFCKNMLTNPIVKTYIQFYMSALVVAKYYSTRKPKEKDPNMVGPSWNRCFALLFESRIQLSKTGKAQFWSTCLPAFLNRWFSPRQTTTVICNIISERDLNIRQRICENKALSDLNHVIDLIRTSNGYRVRISHGKNAGKHDDSNKMKKNLDVSGEDIRRYPYLLEALPEIFDAYMTLTGHRVSHDNLEPRMYLSGYEIPVGEKAGWRYILPCCQFPYAFPTYKHLCKNWISPTCRRSEIMMCKVNESTLLPKALSGNQWYKNDLQTARDHLETMRIPVSIDGEETYTSLTPMLHPNKPRKPAHTLFYEENTSQTVTAKCCEGMQKYIFALIDSGLNETAVKYFGDKITIKFDPIEKEHFRNVKRCRFQHKMIGRQGTGEIEILSCNYLIKKLSACTRAVEELKLRKRSIGLKEDHGENDEYVILKSYPSYKSDELKIFSQLHNRMFNTVEVRQDFRSKVVERLASHKHIKPTRDCMPDTFVTESKTEGTLLDRCGNMEFLSVENGEQSAQIKYLSFHWKIRDVMDELGQIGEIAKHEHFIQKQRNLEEEMTQAGELWESRWRKNKRCRELFP